MVSVLHNLVKVAVCRPRKKTLRVGAPGSRLAFGANLGLRSLLEIRFRTTAVAQGRRDRRSKGRRTAARYGIAVLVDLHPETETHVRQDLLDLVQRLAAKVLGLQHLSFRLLHQLADGLDIR